MTKNRDELIMSMSDIVENIVKKYNGKLDDDLYQDGMLACVKAVDSCLEKGITNYEIIKASCIVRVRNALIDNFKHSNYVNKNTDNDYNTDDIIDYDTLENVDLLVDLYSSLDEKTIKVYEYAIKGFTPKEIAFEMGISLRNVYSNLEKFKTFLKNHNKI